jgi:hypothetical protein
VQEGGEVFVDVDALAKKVVVKRLSGPGGEPVVDLALQQQVNFDAPLRSVLQRLAKGASGVEVGGHQPHRAFRVAYRLDDAAFDGASLAQVVPHQKGALNRAV